jgi:hypothetical protein
MKINNPKILQGELRLQQSVLPRIEGLVPVMQVLFSW